MILQDLIDALRKVKVPKPARYEAPGADSPGPRPNIYPEYPSCYRGNYADLSIGLGLKPITTDVLLSRLEGAIGATYAGWKGGDFSMDGGSLIFAADGPGDWSQLAVSHAEDREDEFVIFLEPEIF